MTRRQFRRLAWLVLATAALFIASLHVKGYL